MGKINQFHKKIEASAYVPRTKGLDVATFSCTVKIPDKVSERIEKVYKTILKQEDIEDKGQ